MSDISELILQLQQYFIQLRSSALPRYKQLYEGLRQQILDGLLLPGMRLPSSRVLANELGLARNTSLAAIEQLCLEGYAIARPNSGVYILPTSPTFRESKNQSISKAMSLGLSMRGKRMIAPLKAKPSQGAFTVGLPDLKQFPFPLWQRYIARHARNPQLAWQAYPCQGGHPELRQTIADYVRLTRGIHCDYAQVLITHSTQQSLQLVADLLADPGDPVWMEDPGYMGARCALEAANLAITYQPIDSEGLSPPLKAWQQAPKLIYTTPSHQYPTGVVMSAARRRQLLALAKQHQSWLLEDDYDSEFRYVGNPIAALHALEPEQVIYLGTFSKSFFPALGIAYMVLPKHLIDDFRAAQARYLREPSYVLQKALADFIRDGHASAHIRKMRREYLVRRDTLIALLQSEIGALVSLQGLETGLHLVVHLPTQMSDQLIAAKAEEAGITTRALTDCYAKPTCQHVSGLVLGFGNTAPEDILRAGKVLCQIIQNEATTYG